MERLGAVGDCAQTEVCECVVELNVIESEGNSKFRGQMLTEL